METFKIEVKETLSRIIEIEANSNDEAVLKVKEMYKKEKIVLSSDDFVTAEIDDYAE
ncbi:MAG: DpnD/PcfM family protein [Bacteroidales bacterium]